MKDFVSFCVWMCFAYAGVIGLLINMFCESKVLHYCWKERDSIKSNKWLKRQSTQLKVQISAFIVGIICSIIYCVLPNKIALS